MTEADTANVAADDTSELGGESPSVEAYNAFIGELELDGIEVVRLSGERRAPGHAPQTRFDLVAGWHVADGAIVWRYDATAHLTDPEGADYGSVEVSVVLLGRLQREVDGACIEIFGGASGIFMAHPYLREAIASTAMRLGFIGVLMPLITSQPDSEARVADGATATPGVKSDHESKTEEGA